MSLEFSHPVALVALLPAAVLIWAYRRSLVDAPKAQRRTSLGVRLVLFTAIVLALAGLTLLSTSYDTMFVCLVDRSRSVDRTAQAEADAFLDDLRARTGAMIVVPFARTPTPDVSEDWLNGTDIAAALESGAARVPAGFSPHLVLLSDGNETTGDALATASRLGVPVSTVPLPAPRDPEVQLDEIRVPPQVRQGEPFYLDVVVRSNIDTEGLITVYRGPIKAAEERKRIEPGENVFRFRQSVDDRRRQDFFATVQADADTMLDNNRASAVVSAGGKARVLLVDGKPDTIRDFAAALREQDITTELRPPEGLPETLDELDRFDAVILSDVPATAIGRHRMELLRAYVGELGGGFLMLGGEQAFGLGGYYKTPIDGLLPVYCDFEKEKEKPSLALCLVIDRSGSMGGRKMELAKDAARAAVELLTPRDAVAVIAFDSESYIVSPLQNAEAAGQVEAAIATIQAAGGTNLLPALVDALEQLRTSTAKLRHVILLTDGRSTPGDFEGVVRRMAADRISLSTVALGDADAELLKSLAELGNGRHYLCDDPEEIPQIFSKETLQAGQSAMQEIPFLPLVVTPDETLAGLDLNAAPPLLGYVVTRSKPSAWLILAAEDETGSADPLLARWRFGLGQAVAFTSDAKSRWAAEWLAWPDFAKFWAQVVRQAMRPATPPGFAMRLERRDDVVRVAVDLVDAADHFIDRAEGQITVIRPDLARESVELAQVGPGRYEAGVVAKEPGNYLVQATLEVPDGRLWTQSQGLGVGYPAELRLRPVDEVRLRRLAESTGGLFRPEAEELSRPLRPVRRATPLWPWLLGFAAVLYVVDVFLRRV